MSTYNQAQYLQKPLWFQLVSQILAREVGSLQSLDWNGGLEWWNGMVEL